MIQCHKCLYYIDLMALTTIAMCVLFPERKSWLGWLRWFTYILFYPPLRSQITCGLRYYLFPLSPDCHLYASFTMGFIFLFQSFSRMFVVHGHLSCQDETPEGTGTLPTYSFYCSLLPEWLQYKFTHLFLVTYFISKLSRSGVYVWNPIHHPPWLKLHL